MSHSDIYPRALRVHAMIKAGEKVNAGIMGRLFELSTRHSQRVFDFLRDTLKAPLEYDYMDRTYYYSDPTFDVPAAIMTEGEAVGLIVAHESLLRLQGTPLGRTLRRSLQTLRHLLPSSVSVDADSLMTQMSFTPSPSRPVSAEILDTLVTCLEKRTAVHLVYYAASADTVSQRDINVYHLAQLRGDWYAVAWCHLRQAVRTFAVSRIQQADPLDCGYTIPSDFSMADYLRDAMGVEAGVAYATVVLQFDANQARWVSERTWHPSQRLATQPGGEVQMRLQVALSTELRQWILSYGPHVEVLEPPQLRREIAGLTEAAASRYRK